MLYSRETGGPSKVHKGGGPPLRWAAGIPSSLVYHNSQSAPQLVAFTTDDCTLDGSSAAVKEGWVYYSPLEQARR